MNDHRHTSDMPWLVRNLSYILVSLVVIASTLAFVVVASYFSQFGSFSLANEQSTWAEFGDYLGGTLNAIFAFFALIALALTLRVQSIELKLSTEELRNSARALGEQNKSLALQNFESSFFQLVRSHNDIVGALDLRQSGQVTAQGRDCFPVFYRRLKIKLAPLLRGDSVDAQDGFETCYGQFFEANEQDLGHYFRHLYRIYKFIDKSTVSDKSDYSGIIRAQLSSNELVLLYYNGLSKHGRKFKPLMEKFELFENLRLDRLIDWNPGALAYSAKAFGDQTEPLLL